MAVNHGLTSADKRSEFTNLVLCQSAIGIVEQIEKFQRDVESLVDREDGKVHPSRSGSERVSWRRIYQAFRRSQEQCIRKNRLPQPVECISAPAQERNEIDELYFNIIDPILIFGEASDLLESRFAERVERHGQHDGLVGLREGADVAADA